MSFFLLTAEVTARSYEALRYVDAFGFSTLDPICEEVMTRLPFLVKGYMIVAGARVKYKS
eukprot:CAMPEP_0170510816 /NCGR_PEP_ID=MMETSP0208-20121228/65969_1 /TAXON_ID=197538 /ORGANISM="Strombidium inclinatum, Strain S3" /LENGTH=59 /DNA_ID=CAMNT_0010794303 /DNA_START=129 /DNA_END=308 /DNA_ORIENTATION=-